MKISGRVHVEAGDLAGIVDRRRRGVPGRIRIIYVGGKCLGCDRISVAVGDARCIGVEADRNIEVVDAEQLG